MGDSIGHGTHPPGRAQACPPRAIGSVICFCISSILTSCAQPIEDSDFARPRMACLAVYGADSGRGAIAETAVDDAPAHCQGLRAEKSHR